MRKTTLSPEMKCPVCGCQGKQSKKGYNSSGTQRCICKECGATYTLNPKRHEYSEEKKNEAIKLYYSGVSGRGVGRLLGMSKANVYNWIKKTEPIVDNSPKIYEMDELYWFIKNKPRTGTQENVYIITLVTRNPRQIVGFDAAFDKSPERIQRIVDAAPSAHNYCTDGYLGYVDLIYPGTHTRNIHNKKDTFTVEGINADLRHYIPILARRSRCFARSLETLVAVLSVFVDAYNRFGVAKYKYRLLKPKGELPFGLIDFL
jgi:transposase-like protein/IS1 family transposase